MQKLKIGLWMMLRNLMSEKSYREMQAAKLKRQVMKRREVKDFDDPVSWIQNNFYIPETNAPMELYPSQIEPLREALSLNDEGYFNYSTICWSAIKKSAKSSIASAVGMWFAFQNPWSQVRIVANSLKQAYSRSYYYCTRAIQLNPHWRESVKVTRNTITLPNGSTITAVPLNPDTEAGGGDDLVMYTEIWAWKHDAALRMWTETTLSPLMYGKSLRWAEGYAGYTGSSPVLEGLYDRGIKNGKLINDEYEMYQNARLFALWQTKPHLPWQTKEYYEHEANDLAESEFNRVHRNQWASAIDTFVPAEWWAACKVEKLPELGKNEAVVIALDAGVSGDNFSIVGVSRHGADGVAVRYSRRWIPPKGSKILFSNPDNPNDRETPEGEIRYLCDNYNVIMVAYDPYQLEDMAARLGRIQGIAWFYAFNQGAARLTSDSNLRTLIKERRVFHNGDVDLAEHVSNAGAKIDNEDHKIRIVKRSSRLKVDLTVSLSMAANEILRLNV